jgi:hypothetical protein
LREQYLKEDISRLIQYLPTSCKSPRHKGQENPKNMNSKKQRKSYYIKEHQTSLVYTGGAPDL